MDIETLRNYCLQKEYVTECFPFGPDTLVFKVCDKLFALTSIEKKPTTVNLKCDPEYAITLRERYDSIIPGYHMNKVHWNTIDIEMLTDDALIFSLIDHSYELVFGKISKTLKNKWLDANK